MEKERKKERNYNWLRLSHCVTLSKIVPLSEFVASSLFSSSLKFQSSSELFSKKRRNTNKEDNWESCPISEGIVPLNSFPERCLETKIQEGIKSKKKE